MEEIQQIRELAVSLSLSTETPIPYWMSRPLLSLQGWVQAVKSVNQKKESGEK